VPTITGLSSAKRRPGWLDIELDGASSFRLPERTARAAGLRVGDPLPRAEIEALRDEAERLEATDVALHYLSYRPRSREETRRHLRRKGYAKPVVVSAVEYCVARGLLNDTAYAAAHARDRFRLAPRSLALIELELRRRGVSADEARAGIAQALEEERVDERGLLERAARRCLPRLRREPPERAERKLYGYLHRRGFRASEALRVVRRLLAEAGDPDGKGPDRGPAG